MAFTWEVQLDNKVSAPAHAMTSALKGFDSELKAIKKSLLAVGPILDKFGQSFAKAGSQIAGLTTPLNRLNGQLLDLDKRGSRAAIHGLGSIGASATTAQKHVAQLQAQLAKGFSTPRMTGGGGSRGSGRGPTSIHGYLAGSSVGAGLLVGSSVLTAAISLGRAAWDVAGGFAHAAMSFGEMAVKQTELKRGIIGQFTGMLGSEGAAKAYYKQLQDIADAGSLKKSDIAPGALRLMNVHGMDSQKAMGMSWAMSDMIANTTVDPQKYKQLVGLVQRGLSGQTVAAKSYNVLGSAIPMLNQGNMVSALAQSRGIKEDRAKFLLSGKASETERASAFWDSFWQIAKNKDKQYGGGVGAATNYFGRMSSMAQITTFQDRINEMFSDVNLVPFAGALASINDALKDGTPAMTELKAVVNDTFKGILDPWIKEYKSDPDKLHRDIQELTDAFTTAGKGAIALSKILHASFDWMLNIAAGPEEMNRQAAGARNYEQTWETPTEKYNRVHHKNLTVPQSELDLKENASFNDIAAQDSRRELLDNITLGAYSAWFPEQRTPEKKPGHAKGGFTTSDHMAMVHQNEGILPLDKVPGIFAQAIVESGGAGGRSSGPTRIDVGGIHVTVQGNGAEEIASQVALLVPKALVSAFEQASMNVTGAL